MQSNQDNQAINDSNEKFDLSIMSVIGDREEQQDSFGYSLTSEECFVVICDGMGGHEGGQLASRKAVETMLSEYKGDLERNETELILIEKAKGVDKQIASLKGSKGEPLQAGSTMVSLIIKDDVLHWCSVGDSRAYLFRQGEFAQVTLDQNYRTVLDEKLGANMITRQEYNEELKRGDALISYLGIGNLSLIDYNSTPFKIKKGDIILITTDGLYRLVCDKEIFDIVENCVNIGEAVKTLETKAETNAKRKNIRRDNMSVALIKIK